MSHIEQFKHLKIQLEAIELATNNFSYETCIGRGAFGKVYKGELVHSTGRDMVALKRLDRHMGQGDFEFWTEIMMLTFCSHENIVSLLGYSDDHDEKILVYEYASRKSLDLYLASNDLTWVQRLKICIGAARGLAYLQNPAETQVRILHCDIKSSNILLDDNWNAKISDFGLSKFAPTNSKIRFLPTGPVGTMGYIDPSYHDSGMLTKESDVYSFGVVLFEVLCGRLCFGQKDAQPLTQLVREYYRENKISELVYSNIKDEIDMSSLTLFVDVAYQCLEENLEERPLMIQIVMALESALRVQEKDAKVGAQGGDFAFHLSSTIGTMSKIRLEAILSATNNFSDDNCIGRGGFGNVYKGELVRSNRKTEVAMKRLNHASNQGDPEFRKEISMLPLYVHENIVSLLGYCDDHDEKVLVYEYLSKKGLDCHLASDHLRWVQRLKICIGAARGIAYLHTPSETQLRIVHRDIKSSNVLLDDNWNAKISDFGLSKFAPANDLFSDVVTSPAGTRWYIDPVYQETMVLTKESDVYSFGVVLFEVLCGRLCFVSTDIRPLIGLVREYYEQNKIHELVYSKIKDEISPSSLKLFVYIAYQCLSRDPKKRRLMTQIVSALERALDLQEKADANAAIHFHSGEVTS